jgi:hypothetical protein
MAPMQGIYDPLGASSLLAILTFISPALILLVVTIPLLQWVGRVSRNIGYHTTGKTLLEHFKNTISLNGIESGRENTQLSDQESQAWQSLVRRLRIEDN